MCKCSGKVSVSVSAIFAELLEIILVQKMLILNLRNLVIVHFLVILITFFAFM